jgi:uncharacterized protein (TIGR03067 family)
MRRLTTMMLIVGTWLVPDCADAIEEAAKDLQGNWTASKAERDGEAADDVVGHRLAFSGDHFKIQDKAGKLLFSGSVSLEPSAVPASIDFVHLEGEAKGEVWKGIYALDGDMLKICDNGPDPEKDRPTAFEAKKGSGHVFITFKRRGVD